MKKISELAEDMDVSRQTIYYWIEKLSPKIQEHIYKDGRSKVLSPAGQDMIKEQVKGKTEIERPFNRQRNYLAEMPADKEKQALKDRISDLQERIEELKEDKQELRRQLQEKDKQIERLQDSLDTAQESITGQVQRPGVVQRIKNAFTSSD